MCLAQGHNIVTPVRLEPAAPFCGFPAYKPVPPGWFKICVGFISGTPEGSTESGFMEKPGIERATPGLQGIALIHYTTAASSNPRPLGLESSTLPLSHCAPIDISMSVMQSNY